VRDDVDSRARRYLVSMGIRTVCFVLAVVTHGWLRWALIFLALTLPYLSVVFANSGRERIEPMPDADLAQDRRAIDGTGRT
jgi:Flp pilus assembly protein TadB